MKYLKDFERDDLEEITNSCKEYKRLLKNLNKKDALYNHNRIMLNRIIYELTMQRKLLKLKRRDNIFKHIKSLFKSEDD